LCLGASGAKHSIGIEMERTSKASKDTDAGNADTAFSGQATCPIGESLVT